MKRGSYTRDFTVRLQKPTSVESSPAGFVGQPRGGHPLLQIKSSPTQPETAAPSSHDSVLVSRCRENYVLMDRQKYKCSAVVCSISFLNYRFDVSCDRGAASFSVSPCFDNSPHLMSELHKSLSNCCVIFASINILAACFSRLVCLGGLKVAIWEKLLLLSNFFPLSSPLIFALICQRKDMYADKCMRLVCRFVLHATGESLRGFVPLGLLLDTCSRNCDNTEISDTNLSVTDDTSFSRCTTCL